MVSLVLVLTAEQANWKAIIYHRRLLMPPPPPLQVNRGAKGININPIMWILVTDGRLAGG